MGELLARHRLRTRARHPALRTVLRAAVAAGALGAVAPGIATADPAGPTGPLGLPLPPGALEEDGPGGPALDALGLSQEQKLQIPLPVPVALPELPLVGFSGGVPAGGAPAGDRVPAAVPTPYRAFVATAARTCPEVTASLIAAQTAVESSWNPAAGSGAGAQGLAQFVPSTWAAYGVDGNGDGRRDPYDPADAIAAQAAHLCRLIELVRFHAIPGDDVDNALAAYNAGLGAVLEYRGIPPYPQTQAYVPKVRKLAAAYDAERAS